MFKKFFVNFFFDRFGHEIIELTVKSGKFTNSCTWDMDSAWTRKQENRFSITKFSIYKSHAKLTIKICIRSYSSDLKINLFIHYEISQHSFNLTNFYFWLQFFGSNTVQERFPFFKSENWSFHWVDGDSDNKFITNFKCSFDNI